jgi:hypothetical protein
MRPKYATANVSAQVSSSSGRIRRTSTRAGASGSGAGARDQIWWNRSIR